MFILTHYFDWLDWSALVIQRKSKKIGDRCMKSAKLTDQLKKDNGASVETKHRLFPDRTQDRVRSRRKTEETGKVSGIEKTRYSPGIYPRPVLPVYTCNAGPGLATSTNWFIWLLEVKTELLVVSSVFHLQVTSLEGRNPLLFFRAVCSQYQSNFCMK